MEPQTLQAEVRAERGKGPARQLRARGLIPAIFYGPGKEPQKLAMSPLALERAISGAYGRNQVIELDIDGRKELALLRDLEVHPLSRRILHADLYSVARDRAVTTSVPFETEGRSIGVQRGGFLRKLYRDLPIRAFPQDVPAKIIVDISPLDVGQTVTVQDLKLPAGVEVTFAPDRRVVIIDAKERKKADEEEAAPAAAAAATPAT
ncbi:MAG: 50S ribosomal protein L25 [Sandaracinaceae bacterium]|nr:50S ribosomal protein L25 [Sandaracinaceae bacterium]